MYDLAILLLSIYPKKTKILIQKDIHTPMFIAALFPMAKIWKQPKYASITVVQLVTQSCLTLWLHRL